MSSSSDWSAKWSRLYPTVKRVVDIVAAGLGLVLLLPVLLVVALLVRVNLGSPVLFRQTRPGLDGKPFEIVKFRSMRDGEGSDAERLTSFGRKLRSTSLDELPELWNVLKGDMSLVGPRPLLMEYLPLYDERQARRHEVRPGITGLAQVSGRNALAWEDRFEADAQYVENESLILDLRIVGKTVVHVGRRDGVSAPGGVTMSKFSPQSTVPGPPLPAECGTDLPELAVPSPSLFGDRYKVGSRQLAESGSSANGGTEL